ncbi:MAG TPA: ABC transporter substrate-binding protein [Polyangiaceae bacterium]|nr:ABC transporter substrate-binding protein [Polyangiaceae bacterium]
MAFLGGRFRGSRGRGAGALAAACFGAAGCHVVTGLGGYRVDECSVNADCARERGRGSVCREHEEGKVCVDLRTEHCPEVIGDYADDDAVIFGALVPIDSVDAPVGKAEVNGIRLAVTEFQASSGGLPPVGGSGRRRPIAVVICDDASRVDRGLSSAVHLAREVRVPAIIGSTFSGVSIRVANDVTTPAGVVLISPGSTSPDITYLQDRGLVWRTIASGAIEAARIVALTEDLQVDVRARLVAAGVLAEGAPLKLQIVYKGDAYGRGFTTTSVDLLRLNGAPATDPSNKDYFRQKDYGNLSDPERNPPRYEETVAELIEQAPHIILAYGVNEVFDDIMGPVERGWSNPSYRPYWVFTHAQFNTAATEFLRANDPDGAFGVRRRMVGTIAGASYAAAYSDFRSLYQGSVNDGTPPDSFGAANAYDALYLLAYAATAATAEGRPLDGLRLADGFARLVPPAGSRAQVGSADINWALGELTAGRSVDLEGATGPLDFDLATGDADAEVEVWCVPEQSGGAGLPVTTPFRFDIRGQRVGSLAQAKSACGLL